MRPSGGEANLIQEVQQQEKSLVGHRQDSSRSDPQLDSAGKSAWPPRRRAVWMQPHLLDSRRVSSTLQRSEFPNEFVREKGYPGGRGYLSGRGRSRPDQGHRRRRVVGDSGWAGGEGGGSKLAGRGKDRRRLPGGDRRGGQAAGRAVVPPAWTYRHPAVPASIGNGRLRRSQGLPGTGLAWNLRDIGTGSTVWAIMAVAAGKVLARRWAHTASSVAPERISPLCPAKPPGQRFSRAG